MGLTDLIKFEKKKSIIDFANKVANFNFSEEEYSNFEIDENELMLKYWKKDDRIKELTKIVNGFDYDSLNVRDLTKLKELSDSINSKFILPKKNYSSEAKKLKQKLDLKIKNISKPYNSKGIDFEFDKNEYRELLWKDRIVKIEEYVRSKKEQKVNFEGIMKIRELQKYINSQYLNGRHNLKVGKETIGRKVKRVNQILNKIKDESFKTYELQSNSSKEVKTQQNNSQNSTEKRSIYDIISGRTEAKIPKQMYNTERPISDSVKKNPKPRSKGKSVEELIREHSNSSINTDKEKTIEKQTLTHNLKGIYQGIKTKIMNGVSYNKLESNIESKKSSSSKGKSVEELIREHSNSSINTDKEKTIEKQTLTRNLKGIYKGVKNKIMSGVSHSKLKSNTESKKSSSSKGKSVEELIREHSNSSAKTKQKKQFVEGVYEGFESILSYFSLKNAIHSKTSKNMATMLALLALSSYNLFGNIFIPFKTVKLERVNQYKILDEVINSRISESNKPKMKQEIVTKIKYSLSGICRVKEKLNFDFGSDLKKSKAEAFRGILKFNSGKSLDKVMSRINLDEYLKIQDLEFPLAEKYHEIIRPYAGRQHQGVDFAAPVGSEVYAIDDGKVVYSGWIGSKGGNAIKIEHKTPDGEVYYSLYMHLSKCKIKTNHKIKKGDVVGFVGKTGNAKHTKSHLHFAIRSSSKNIEGIRASHFNKYFHYDPLKIFEADRELNIKKYKLAFKN